MRVSDSVRECVCFVCVIDQSGSAQPIGTAFMVGILLDPINNISTVYLVTARHVIAGASLAGHTHTVLRLNTMDGKVGYVRVANDLWMVSEDDTEADDLAVLQYTPQDADYDYQLVSYDSVASEEKLAAYDVGVGDEVFLPGLFVNHVGSERNLPIVRTGTIAAMPHEPIASKLGTLTAFLIEARSMGGLSGSPVFVNLGARGAGSAFLLLGVMHGHFIKPIPAVLPEPAGISDETINMGSGIVVPASRIRRLIDRPELVAKREEARERFRAMNQAGRPAPP